MKVLLIAPPIMDYVNGECIPIAMDAHRECPPYGMYLLVSILRGDGHEVVFADLIADGTSCIESYRDDLDNCGLVGIGATSMSWPTARVVIEQVRAQREDVSIVLGGIHPTMFDRYILDVFPVNFIVRGEGEVALTELVHALETHQEFAQVPNLTWRAANGEVVRNPVGSLIHKTALTSFPLPDYSEMPSDLYHGLSIESSRGCAFDCSFCSTSYRRTWRGMAHDEFVDRLEAMLPHADRTMLGTVHIIDDEFSLNTKRAVKIADLLGARGLTPNLVFDSRANDLVKDGFVESIAPFTSQFLVGAECGYDEGLKRIGKGTTTDKLEAAAKLLKKNGLSDRADFSFVLGLPWESVKEVEKTIAFAIHLHAMYGVRILLQWYCQIPGSRLWDDDYKKGLITEAMYDDFGFFGNLFLFRSAVKLTPKEIYTVSDKVSAMLTAVRSVYNNVNMIEYAFPEPIARFYPRFLEAYQDTGLASLREVARPQRDQVRRASESTGRQVQLESGIPLRHFEGVFR